MHGQQNIKICAHPQEDNCINTTSGIITEATMYSSYFSNFSNFRPLSYFQSDYTRSCIHTIVLLRTNIELLETCRGFK